MNYGLRITVLLAACWSLSGCISDRSLLRAFRRDQAFANKQLSPVINGVYSNGSDSSSHRLIGDLLSCLSFDEEEIAQQQGLSVKLDLQQPRQLHVQLLRDQHILRSFDLKVRRKGNYIRVKRNLSLLPIPLFYVCHERKLLLAVDAQGNLLSLMGTGENGMVLFIVAGYTNHDVTAFRRLP